MKKIIRTFLLVVGLTPLVMLLVSALAYWFYGLLALGGESTPHQHYLKRNQQLVSGGASDFTLFDETFYQNQVFMLAEVHGFEQPQTLDLSLLKHLHQRVGVRYYLAEVDYCQAYFLNQYLQTGREALLRSVFQIWIKENAQWGNRQFYDKIKKIRVYNLTLPEKSRIRFLGVDRLQDLALTKRFLELSLRDSVYRSAKEPFVDSLRRVVSAPALNEQKLVDAAKHFLAAKAEGTEDAALSHVLRNLVYYGQKTNRDSVMYLNLKDLTRTLRLDQEKLYGLWGFFHTLPGTVNGGKKKPFAAYLKQADSPFRGKVVAMNIYALDSENMMPSKALPASINPGKAYVNTTWANGDGPLAFTFGVNDLRAVTEENTITLFKLSGEESPYWHSSQLTRTKVIIPGQSIEADGKDPRIPDAFPYVFLMRNSKALQPL